MPGTAGGADPADDSENHVLRGHPGGEFAVDGNPHILRRLLDQRLRRQHMFDLGGADAEGKRPKSAVRGGMRVAADDGHARLREALFRPDHMDDALADIIHGEERHAEFGGVAGQGLDLNAGFLILDSSRAVGCRNVVVGDGERAVRGPNRAARGAQTFEGLRARHLVNEMPVDIDQTGTVVLAMHDMRIPDLVKQGLWRRHVFLHKAAGEVVILAGPCRQEEDASRVVVFSAMRAALPVRPRR